MRRRFFVERFENGSAVLRGDAAHHVAHVLRAEPGRLYELSDGEAVWLARTERAGPQTVEFSLVERLPVYSSAVRITLLLAIIKFDRFEWGLEKATELGVDAIMPLAAERSEKGLVEASAKRMARWQKILLESAQQSRRLRLPELREAQKPKQAFAAADAAVKLLLSERESAAPMREILEGNFTARREPQPANVVLGIGPEGGWTDAEFVAATEAGFHEAALGSNILRTETALCAALGALQYAFASAQSSQK
jgi:16S rRNA (uracil1498-N3)-methyltransferase